MAKIPESLLTSIHNAQNILLVTHIHPDGDALGSTFGLQEILAGMGKNVCVFLEEPVTSMYAFLPGANRAASEISAVRTFIESNKNSLIAIALDSGDDNRLGKYKDDFLAINPLLVIDHHKSHKDFGEHRWVETGMSSTGEMVYEMALSLGAQISYDAAVNIYVAICTDTGSFRYDSTKPRTLQIAADLIEAGVLPDMIATHLYDNFSLERLKLMRLVLSTLRLYAKDQLACIHLTRKMLDESGAELHEAEGFIDYPRSLRSVKVAMFVKENSGDQIAVSLRSKGAFDVSEIAKLFGGGGHRKAAGFRFYGKSLEHVTEIVLQSLLAKLN